MRRIHIIEALILTTVLHVPAYSEEPKTQHEYTVTKLTLMLQDSIHLDSTLYREIDTSLSIAEDVNDTLKGWFVRPSWEFNTLNLYDAGTYFIDSWAEGELTTGYPYIDSLCQEYGLVGVEGVSSISGYNGFYNLTFSQPLQIPKLAPLYEAASQIEWAEQNGFYYQNSPDDVRLKRRPDGDHFIFYPGHYNSDYFFVRVAEGAAERFYADGSTEIPYWSYISSTSLIACYGSVSALIDSIRTSSTWWIQENAMQVGANLLQDIDLDPEWDTEEILYRNELLESFDSYLDACKTVIVGNDSYLSDFALESYKRALPPYPYEWPGITPYFAEGTYGSTMLSWDPAYPDFYADSCDYELHVSGTTEPYVTDATSVSFNTLYNSLPLSKGTKYDWWIEARHVADPNRYSKSSEGTLLYYSPIGPASFGLVSPPDEAVLDGNEVDVLGFIWNDAKGGPTAGEVDYNIELTNLDTGQKQYLSRRVDTTRYVYATILHGYGSPVHIEWRVRATSSDQSLYSDDTFSFTYILPDSMTQVAGRWNGILPNTFTISSTYPNPFNPATTVTVAMPERGNLKLEVYNLLGQRVATLAAGVQEAGWRSFVLDGSNLASGVYLLRAYVPDKLGQVKKITLVR